MSRRRVVFSTAFLLLSIGGFLRLYGLGHYPLPMHQDELSNAYDAYSIVETGADRSGARYPLILRGQGEVDYRPALYTYLAVVPIAIFGFSPAAARLPSAILGVASLLLLFLFSRDLGGDELALIALTFAVFSPWEILFSRIAHHGAMLPPFFLILTLWLWRRAATHLYVFVRCTLIGLSLGLSTNGYPASHLVSTLMGVVILADTAKHSKTPGKSSAALVFGSVVGAAPQLYALVAMPELFFVRARVTLMHFRGWGNVVHQLVHNLGFVFNPWMLFSPRIQDTGMLVLRLLPVSILFYYLGFFAFSQLRVSQASRFKGYTYASFVIGILPGLITGGSSSIRFATVLPLLSLFSAAGVCWIADRLTTSKRAKGLIYAGWASTMLLSFVFVLHRYLASPVANGLRSNNSLVQVGLKLKTLNPRYSRVFVVDSPWYSGLHVAAFSGMRPLEFQRTRKIEVDSKGWDYVRSVGKYQFLRPRELTGEVERAIAGGRSVLFVSRDRIARFPPIDSVGWYNEKYYFTEVAR